MNIVCIGWGSLLWKPQGLELASGWQADGPHLPLEFARQSDDSPELALVLCDGAPLTPTCWAYLATADLGQARAMLHAREKITPERLDWIGSIPSMAGAHEDERIAQWLRLKGLGAAVWTAVPPKFNGVNGCIPSAADVLDWLGGLEGEQRAGAEEYIRNTPARIATPYRRLIEARLGWLPVEDVPAAASSAPILTVQ